MKGNRLGINGGLKDIEYIVTMKNLSCLDISDNKIDCEDPNDFINIFERMHDVRVLYLFGNPVIKKIQNYRKTLIARLPNLRFLDDRPVFEEDRIFAEAFYKGGIQAEREARKEWKEKKAAEERANHEAFRAM